MNLDLHQCELLFFVLLRQETATQTFPSCDEIDASAAPEGSEKDSPSSSQKPNRTVCAVPGCKSRYGRSVSFHSFPKKDDHKRWKAWLRELKLKYEPTSTARVCSLHFSVSNFISPTTSRLTDRMILKSSAVPDLNLPQPPRSATVQKLSVDRATRIASRERNKLNMEIDESDKFRSMMTQTEEIKTAEAEIQVDTLDMDKLFQGRQRTMAVVFKTDVELNSWTGLNSLNMLDAIEQSIRTLSAYKASIYSTITLRERVLLVFIKLKTNLTFSCMSTLFHLHYQTVSQTFFRTIPWIRAVCEPLVYWPSQAQIKRNLPHYFRPTYEDVVAVLDCTEIAIKKPACLHCRINAYSHYKGRETAKYLIAVTPGGTISFISRGYGGKCSDKQIVIQENVLDKINVGESVMTDKGFLIDDECRKKGVKLVRPPFLRAPLTQLSQMDATENVSIAAARVHVERAIQRVKQFGILNDKVDNHLIPVLDDIMLITCGITNVSKPILSNERF